MSQDTNGTIKPDEIVSDQEFQNEQNKAYQDEIVIGLVAPVGTDLKSFETLLDDLLINFGYKSNTIKLSKFLESKQGLALSGTQIHPSPAYKRYTSLMDAGNEVRKNTKVNDFLAQYAISKITTSRELDEQGDPKPLKGRVHILHSLKHKEEVTILRDVYGNGFFLVGIFCYQEQRRLHLQRSGISEEEAYRLILRDYNDNKKFGQQTSKVYELSDVFIHLDTNNLNKTKSEIERFLELIFGNPFRTPTKDENAMFLAYASSLRSGSLARQVGAVITTTSGEIIATGTNDTPKFGGGQYCTGDDDRRDHARGFDSNTYQRNTILKTVYKAFLDNQRSKDKKNKESKNESSNSSANEVFDEKLKIESAIGQPKKVESELTSQQSEDVELQITDDQLLQESKDILAGTQIFDLTEYGRDVHAEMEAILCCARIGVSPKGCTLYTTTFPCHNCAKHIVAAGIERVVYVEPYPKSKAQDLHSDSIEVESPHKTKDKVRFEPFIGIGPRKYFELFTLSLGTGRPLERKDDNGNKKAWISSRDSYPRMQMTPMSYLERERRIAEFIESTTMEVE